MATRFYTSNTTPEISPAEHGDWDQFASIRRLSQPSYAGTGVSGIGSFEVSAINEYKVLLVQYVTMQLGACVIPSATAIDCAFMFSESAKQANFYEYYRIRKCDGDGGNIVDDLIASMLDDTEFDDGALESRYWSDTFSGDLTLANGDRLIFELGFQANNTKTTQYNGDISSGSHSSYDDVEPNDSDTDPFTNSWLEINYDIPDYVPPSGGYVPKIMMIT